jgi:hypothetical protein
MPDSIMKPDDNYRIPDLDKPPIEKLIPSILNPPKAVSPAEVVEQAARRSWLAASPVLGALAILLATSQQGLEAIGLAALGGWLLRR